MKPFKTYAYIYSLNKGKLDSTEMGEITVLEEIGNNLYKVEYGGVICTAVFNYFNCAYYADDVYGRGLFCVIAHSPDELINEGEMLHHCVGKMNYDQKFAREESLIFFIRSNEEPNKPFVTVEYSLSRHIVLQCLGDHNSKPNAKTMRYINKVWLPYANKQLKQLAA